MPIFGTVVDDRSRPISDGWSVGPMLHPSSSFRLRFLPDSAAAFPAAMNSSSSHNTFGFHPNPTLMSPTSIVQIRYAYSSFSASLVPFSFISRKVSSLAKSRTEEGNGEGRSGVEPNPNPQPPNGCDQAKRPLSCGCCWLISSSYWAAAKMYKFSRQQQLVADLHPPNIKDKQSSSRCIRKRAPSAAEEWLPGMVMSFEDLAEAKLTRQQQQGAAQDQREKRAARRKTRPPAITFGPEGTRTSIPHRTRCNCIAIAHQIFPFLICCLVHLLLDGCTRPLLLPINSGDCEPP